MTTEFLARTSGLPVYTVDSRTALRQWLGARASRDVLLAYLDAHWRDDLPARDEVQIIFERCPRSVVVIDDFEVPDDPGYAFDDYGPGKVLNLQYLEKEIVRFALQCFFPACPSSLETGARRGRIALARRTTPKPWRP